MSRFLQKKIYWVEHPPYGLLRERVEFLRHEITKIAARSGIDYRINAITGMFTGFFSKEEVWDFETASQANRALYERFFKLMLEEGIFFAPSPFEASFVTLGHGEAEMTGTIEAFEKVFANLKD